MEIQNHGWNLHQKKKPWTELHKKKVARFGGGGGCQGPRFWGMEGWIEKKASLLEARTATWGWGREGMGKFFFGFMGALGRGLGFIYNLFFFLNF